MKRGRGRPPKGIERILCDLVPLDLRYPVEPGFVMIEGTHHEARLAELDWLCQEYPLRVQSAYRAYIDFLAEYGFEPQKSTLQKFAIEKRYPDLPAVDDLKGWTRAWRDAGLGFLSPHPLMRCDPDLLAEMESEILF